MKNRIIRFILILTSTYLVICLCLFFFQESLIFHPKKLDNNYSFKFSGKFEEIDIAVSHGVFINGLLFKADSSKGLIFYLHGNTGSLDNWGNVAKFYNRLHYDIYIPDYRGFGKSDGSIYNQDQLFTDIQFTYENMKRRYPESKIVVIGYSIGTGPAAKIASTNNPRKLILQAPYYSLTDLMKRKFPIIPTFILKYRFEINKYLKDCKMPVTIFHGDNDEVIYYGSSLKLRQLFKHGDTMITLHGAAHNGITDNTDYRIAIQKILGTIAEKGYNPGN